jgi:hypothetical protein
MIEVDINVTPGSRTGECKAHLEMIQSEQKHGPYEKIRTWTAMYAMDWGVTLRIPIKDATLDRVAV